MIFQKTNNRRLDREKCKIPTIFKRTSEFIKPGINLKEAVEERKAKTKKKK